MKIFSITITEDDIREDVETAVDEAELLFTDENCRSSFINDCVACVIDKYSMYEVYDPDYRAEVLDLYRIYHLHSCD